MTDYTFSCRDCLIGSCALYSLSDRELSLMESHAHKTGFSKGEILRRQDTPMESIIYLRSGFVKEFIKNELYADQVVQLIKPRSYIGLQGFFTNTSSTFTYQAITDIDVCYIEKGVFSELVSGNGIFAKEILIALSIESLKIQKRFLSLNQKQMFGKVAGLILYLAEEIFESNTFELNLRREELAQMIASTRESVTRTLNWFRDEGIIEMKNAEISILNKERIAEMALKG